MDILIATVVLALPLVLLLVHRTRYSARFQTPSSEPSIQIGDAEAAANKDVIFNLKVGMKDVIATEFAASNSRSGLVIYSFSYESEEEPPQPLPIPALFGVNDTEYRSTGDDTYGDFVAAMWAKRGVDLGGLELSYRRMSNDDRSTCRVMSIVENRGSVYANVIDDGEGLTFNVHNGHRWQIEGEDIDEMGFRAVLRGVDPAVALAPKSYPASPAEALALDRWPSPDRRWIIGFRDRNGRSSYRIVSRVIRLKGTLHATCHLRWGARRAFRFDGIFAVHDVATGAPLNKASFLTPQAKTSKAPSAKPTKTQAKPITKPEAKR